LSATDAQELLKDFQKYSKETGKIQIYTETNEPKTDYSGRVYSGKDTYRIRYFGDDRGVCWTIWFCNWAKDFKHYMVEAKINPKILAGINDYVTASSEACLNDIENCYNWLAKGISPLLGKFRYYKLKRVDFCINFDLKEMGIECTPEQMISLIKRGYIPNHYKEFEIYDKIQHRYVTDKSSFYLKSN
jgi:hypothetical protein